MQNYQNENNRNTLSNTGASEDAPVSSLPEYPTGTKKPRGHKMKIGYVLLSAGIAVASFAGGYLANYLSLDEEVRSLLKLKNRIQSSYYEEITDEQFYNVLFQAVNEKLLDQYSGYMTAEEYAATRVQAQGKQSGVGLVFSSATDAAELQILRVCGNSPAEQKGIKAGEYILGYGGSADEIVEATTFDAFSEFLDGYETDECFFLKVGKSTEDARVVELCKQAYEENYVFYRTKDKSYGFTDGAAATAVEGDNALSVLNESTAYIQLTQFNGAAAEQFGAAMTLFKTDETKTDLVLDLRGDGGGYLDIMLQIARYFCKSATEEHPIIAIADYGEYKQAFAVSGSLYNQYFTAESHIYVLADKNTASASECLLGCMYDYDAIEYGDICLIEEDGVAKTYGKGIMQTTFPLSGLYGDAVKLTTAKILWPSGHCIHGVGINAKTDNTKKVADNADDEAEIVAAIQTLYGQNG